MKRYLGELFATALFLCIPARADDQAAKSILDKAITALGGEEKLGKAKAFTLKSKGTLKFDDLDRAFNRQVTVQGLDHFRSELDIANFHGLVVLAGDKGWRTGGGNLTELAGDALANEKRSVYLLVVPVTLLQLKGSGFRYGPGGEEKVGENPAVILKVTGPDGKDFALYFDKKSGLPVKLIAKVIGFSGQENELETTFGDYRELDGIKKATKIEVKRNGAPFQSMEVIEFKVLDKVDPQTFAEPK
jgi:hypothetical protein